MDRVCPRVGNFYQRRSRRRESRSTLLRHSPWREHLGAGHGSRASIPRSRRVRHPRGQDEDDLARDLYHSQRLRHLDHDDEQAAVPFDVRYGSKRRDDDRHDCVACACDEHPRESWIR